MANTFLTTDLASYPYLDDFNASKRFYRILFRPTYAVQTRELNQLQTILQNQIQLFASHVFKDGTPVDGCAVKYNPRQQYVHIKNAFNSNTQISLLNFNSDYVFVANTGVRAVARVIKQGFEAQYPATNRLYVDYLTTGKDISNNDVKSFQSGETLYVYKPTQSKLGTLDANNFLDTINVITANGSANSVGTAYSVTVGEGVVYQKGFFTLVTEQTITVRDFDTNTYNMAVGFTTDEYIITEDNDPSLNDQANGTTNYVAPGAHRLNLVPRLVAVDKTDIPAGNSFLSIAEFDQNAPVQEVKDTVYSALGSEFAKRTREESGDYVVKPFAVESLVHTTNTALMTYAVSPGIGYVQGYRIEYIGTKTVDVERAIDTQEAQSQVITANFGSYIYINEMTGLFNFDSLDVITIYDTVQQSVSLISGSGSALVGNAIGTARARGLSYVSGVKGTSSSVYALYLSNIIMNSGKSFSVDAKSFYINGSFGKAKADIVGTLKEGNKDNLYFTIGTNSLKRLRDSNGVNDTQFVYRDIQSATLQANGFATFTINTPYAGGNERLNASPGTLSDINELEYNFALSTEAYSSNQTGTISVSGTTVTGIGTSLNTQYYAGSFIRLPSSGNAVRRVVSVTNSTSMTINSTVSASANVHQRYFPQGHVFNVADANGSINIISNTQFSVNTNMSLDSGSQTIYSQYPVLRTQAVAKAKEANKTRYVKINCNTGGIIGPWNLGIVDVYKLNAVYIGSGTYATSNPNKISWFNIDYGQRTGSYEHARLTVKPEYASQITSGTRLLVELSHFTANTSAGIGFFSVDSYPFIKPGDTANTTNVSIADVPLLGGLDVRSYVDFRPQRYNTSNSASVVADATENPVAANTSFNIGSGSYLISPQTNFQADIEYYLPRRDLLVITSSGDLSVKKGVPSFNPVSPIAENDGMPISQIYVPAYPSLTTREGESFDRYDLSSYIKVVTNRGWDMKSIGVLDQRIKRLEYYVTLNALEQQAKDMSITDSNGLDRFKNGIFADPMKNHNFGDVGDQEYKISIDADRQIGRPFFKRNNVDYIYYANQSSGIQQTGYQISRTFTPVLYISQPYASKFRNCTESVWTWNGKVTLYPSMDNFRDETRLPSENITIDTATAWSEFAASPFGTDYGDWRVTSSQVVGSKTGSKTVKSTSDKFKTSAHGGAQTAEVRLLSQTVETTKAISSSRDVMKLEVDTTSSKEELGSFVTGVTQNPYIRAQAVSFLGTGLKPNTQIFAFFDNMPVSAYCVPGLYNGSTDASKASRENALVTANGAQGSKLFSDASGNVSGLFYIPEGKFRTGDRVFILTDVEDLVTGADSKLTTAQATFTASSLSVTTKGLSVTTIEPEFSINTDQENKVVRETTKETLYSVDVKKYDPIAQSFLVTAPSDVTGSFIDKIGVYFKSKDPTLGISCILVEMNAGSPNSSRVISEKHLTSAQVSISSDGTVETIFDFDDLPFVSSGNFYAFLIKPDADSPEYKIWMAETGGIDIASNRQIFSNPYIGTAFISANMQTWTVLQKEDIKFNIYRCSFDVGSSSAVFFNEDDDYLKVDGVTLANASFAVQTGDIVYRAISGVPQLTNTSPYGTVQEYDAATDKIIVNDSRGNYAVGQNIQIHRPYRTGSSTINANTLIGSANIVSMDNQNYSAIVPRFAYIEPTGTSVNMTYRGVSNTYVVDSTGYSVVPEQETEKTDYLRIIASRSNEVSLGANTKSSKFTIEMETKNSYVSPLVDLRRKSSYAIENIINNLITNEHLRTGSALSKYVSPIIQMAAGQDAEDLEVFVTMYRPVGTDFQVYAKFQSSEDISAFTDRPWTLLSHESISQSSIYSASANDEDFIEYRMIVPTSAPVTNAAYRNATNNNIVQYVAPDGSIFVTFLSFAIKIVLLSSASQIVPYIGDVRAIALQV